VTMLRIIPLSLAAILLLGCSEKRDREVVAWVNNQPLYLSDFKEQLEKDWMVKDSGAKELDYRLKLKCLEDMIKRRLILNEAGRLGLSVPDQELEAELTKTVNTDSADFRKSLEENGITEREWKEQVRDDLLIRKTVDAVMQYQYRVTNQEMKEFYNRHLSEFVTPEQFQVKQIILQDENRAKEALELLRKGALFEELARTYSVGPEAQSGGDLGWLEPEQLPSPLHEELIKLSPGMVSGLIKSPFGYHVLKLESVKMSLQMSYGEAEPKIQQVLAERKKNALYQEWIQMLWKRSAIKSNHQVL